MTIKQALEKYPIQLSAQLIRVWITNNTCPFGYIVRQKDKKNGRNTYYINETELQLFLAGTNNAPNVAATTNEA